VGKNWLIPSMGQKELHGIRRRDVARYTKIIIRWTHLVGTSWMVVELGPLESPVELESGAKFHAVAAAVVKCADAALKLSHSITSRCSIRALFYRKLGTILLWDCIRDQNKAHLLRHAVMI